MAQHYNSVEDIKAVFPHYKIKKQIYMNYEFKLLNTYESNKSWMVYFNDLHLINYFNNGITMGIRDIGTLHFKFDSKYRGLVPKKLHFNPGYNYENVVKKIILIKCNKHIPEEGIINEIPPVTRSSVPVYNETSTETETSTPTETDTDQDVDAISYNHQEYEDDDPIAF